ncbi:DUF551 domain-containing protein [Enterobacter roggenkampii]|uniref:DUF551 domain-containing protein n=1 Tax=Enterobacter roggenkampii TaxID=1812935 RepID=UPI001910F34E|nr:DUF551 domain-containing protein [Enterobacter roggenkampii]
MTTTTKELLIKIQLWRETYGPGSNVVLPAEEAEELARIALASLEAEAVGTFKKGPCGYHPSFHEDAVPLYTAPPAPANAEPVAWLWSHRKHPSEVTLVRPEDDEKAEGAHWSGWSCQALYAAPPAPVSVPDFPEILPCPVILEPGLRFGKGVPTKAMLGALQRRAEHYAELEAMTPEQRAKHDAGMKEFAAMLQGAEPVTTAYKLQDGWVACSERMPGMGVDVLACTISPIGGFEEIETAQWHGGMKGEQPVFITSADAIEPTHWMPLPAAPLQEVK